MIISHFRPISGQFTPAIFQVLPEFNFQANKVYSNSDSAAVSRLFNFTHTRSWLPMALSSPFSYKVSSTLLSNDASDAITKVNQAKICPSTSLTLPQPLLNSICKTGFSFNLRKRESRNFHICASVTEADVSVGEYSVQDQISKGDTWSIHKFWGYFWGTSERIQNVAEIIVKDDSERKLVIVSAMSKVTDMMYDLIDKAQSRDDSYELALDVVFEKHKLTTLDLLDGIGTISRARS